MAQQYSAQSWEVGSPITQTKMERLENGLEQATIDLNACYTKDETDVIVATAQSTAEGAAANARTALSTATQALGETQAGKDAWDQVNGALPTDNEGNPNGTLVDRFEKDERNIAQAQGQVQNIQTEITEALGTLRFFGQGVAAEHLYQRLDDMSDQIANNFSGIGTINNIFEQTKGNFSSLRLRLNAIDGNPTDTTVVEGGRLGVIEGKIEQAENGKASMHARFVEDETAITNLGTDKINYTDIVDNLNQTDTNKPLSANQGNVIKNTLGTGFDTSHTVATAISTAQTNAANIAQDYADTHKVDKTDIYNGVDHNTDDEKVLDARVGKTLQDNITAEATARANADSGLDSRITALETEVDEANGNGTLDDRFDAIEGNINTIAGELAMIDQTGAIVDTNTRVDRLNDNVLALGKEIGMLSEETTLLPLSEAIDRSNTQIDQINTSVGAINTELNNARVQIGTDAQDQPIMSTLDQRLDGIDSDISHQPNALTHDPGGLTERMTAAENDISHAVGTNGQNDKGGLTERIGSIEGSLESVQEALDAVPSADDVNQLKTDVAGLKTTTQGHTSTLALHDTAITNNANAIAANSTTVILTSADINYDANNVPTTLKSGNLAEKDDYLIENPSDHKYYYWKWILTNEDPETHEWVLISGAGGSSGGGSGNNNAATFSTVADFNAAEKDENMDYYVLESDGYHHYRYLKIADEVEEGAEQTYTYQKIEIGSTFDSSNVKTYNVAVRSYTETENDKDVVNSYLFLFEFNYGSSNNLSDSAIDTLIENEQYFKKIKLPATGGGGAVNTMSIRQITPPSFTAAVNSDVRTLLRFFFTTGEVDERAYYSLTVNDNTVVDNELIISGNPADKSYNWPTKVVNGETVLKDISEVPKGFSIIDITDYCEDLKDYTIGLTIRSETNSSIFTTADWRLHMIRFELTSNAPEGLIIDTNQSATITYTPTGDIDKVLHIVIDNDTAHMTSQNLGTSSGGQREYTLTAQSHGVHKIEMYMTASANGVPLESAHLTREYIWYDPENTQVPIIIASPLNGTTKNLKAYNDLIIPYSVYHKEAGDYNVYAYLNYGTENQELISTVVQNGNVNTSLTYTPTKATADTSHPDTLTILVGNAYITINLIVSALTQNVSPIPGAIIDFDPALYTNNSINREPTWTNGAETYKWEVSPNFNWSTNAQDSGGGYKEDADGKCFVIKAGSYVNLNYKMFQSVNGQSKVFDTGTEMKIIFKTAAVRSADAVWFDNTSTLSNKSVGIQLNAHNGWLKTDKASDITLEDTTEEYPAWESGKTDYVVGTSIVVYKNIIYKYVKAAKNYTIIVPGSDAAVDLWEGVNSENVPQDATVTDWVSGTLYSKDAYVRHVGLIYKAATDITNEFTINPKNASKLWLKMGATDTEILATNSYLYFPYSEGDKIELDININQYDSSKNNNFIMSYEDGVPSKAYSYTYGSGGDGLRHTLGSEATIRIGSTDCDVYIYKFRIYNKSLKDSEVLQNFIADGKTVQEKIARYDRNCIYWDNYKFTTTTTGGAKLNPIKLAECMPEVKVLMLDTPVFTTGKKDFIKGSSLRCLQIKKDENGNPVYPDEGNWFFQDGFHAGQGTTSDNYGQAGRNVDFLFIADGKHWPTKKKDIEKTFDLKGEDATYISSVLRGYTASKWNETTETWEPSSVYNENTEEWEPNSILTNTERENWVAQPPEYCEDWKGDKCKVALTPTSVPNNYFNLKVNIASSENVNNALFQKRYNDFVSYKSPAYAAQIAKHGNAYAEMGLNTAKIKVKNSMEFVPAVLFVREYDPTISKHTEFKDTEWHFYALGNIGDSKKTDYTRAYDPDDMNEFTVENSDNNTNNGQFQSGVFTYNGNRAVETSFDIWKNTVAYKTNDIVVKDGHIYKFIAADMAALGENETTTWTVENWQDVTPSTTGTIYYAPRTAPNPMAYLFPITPEEWNVQLNGAYVNFKHKVLLEEEFDGDHSFEFRYACCGDYRDGSLINDTNGNSGLVDGEGKAITNDTIQYNLNHDTVIAFYEWLVTSTKAQYEAEATQWFVPEAMEFFYAYTHYYTMMDNRAKNTFWHFAKTGKYRRASRPVPELLHVYEESNDAVADSNGVYTGTFTPTSDTSIDPQKTYYTQYAFDLWVYDCDTAAGIDNNGALVFPYGKEDDDYRTEGDPASGYAFNGAGSIFWRRLKDSFTEEVRSVMTSTPVECFNSQNLIDEFDDFQACYPEEIWRLDIERKYIRTFTGVSNNHPYDNAVETGKQNPRFLTSMMQGRKKYQRRQWIRDQGVYFNSKYRLPDILDNSNTIEFNCTTPAADAGEIAVTPNYELKLKPYQDMYLNITIGNGTYLPPERAKAGREYTFDLTEYSSGNFQETRIYINGANYLSAISNMAPMYPYSFDLRALNHIKTLDIGTDNSGYNNTKLTELVLPTNVPLLESLNIKNCHTLGGNIQLSQANNLKTIEAEGTVISGINLPAYTNIETLHLPSTVTDLSLNNAHYLTDFYMKNNNDDIDYSNLFTLNVIDSDYSADYKESASDPLPVDWMSVARAMINKTNAELHLVLTNLYSAEIGDIQTLEEFANVKTATEALGGTIQLSGLLHVLGYWSEIERDTYAGQEDSVWPDLTLDTTQGTQEYKYKVTYCYDYGDHDEIMHLYIKRGDPIIDIWQYLDDDTGEIVQTLSAMPSRAPTVQHTYQFGERSQNRYLTFSGWKRQGDTDSIRTSGSIPVVTGDMTIETWFKEEDCVYPIKWYLRKNVNGTGRDEIVMPGNDEPYGGGYDRESPTVDDIHNAGFETAIVDIVGGTATYQIFDGWEKLPTNIQPTVPNQPYEIFAKWNIGSVALIDLFTAENTGNLTAEQLLVLSAMSPNQRSTYTNDKIAVNKQITFTMGHDNNRETGTEIISANNILRLDDEMVGARRTNIQPMDPTGKTNGDAFTIAFDYCFNKDATYDSNYNAAILASCYSQNTSANTKTGFVLYYNLKADSATGATKGPRIGFGDVFNNASQSIAIGNDKHGKKYRNMVVLRHPAGSDTLYIYSGHCGPVQSEDDAFTKENVLVDQIRWNNSTTTAYLNLGRITDSSDTEYTSLKQVTTKAQGTIFWAKYWNEDLGVGECKRLAAWPHEQMTYAIAMIGNHSTSSRTQGDNPIPALGLTALTSSMHAGIAMPADGNVSSIGWNISEMRKICNNRVFPGLPTELQAILCKASISSKTSSLAASSGGATSMSQYALDANPVTTRDYIYVPSVANVRSKPTLSDDYSIEITKLNNVQYMYPFDWLDTSNVTLYDYSTSSPYWTENASGNRIYQMNLRFPIKPITYSSTNKLRIFKASTALADATIETAISRIVGGIKPGDIFLDATSNPFKAYMYVSTEDITTYGLQIEPQNDKFATRNNEGGWIASVQYWLRSPCAGYYRESFAYVKYDGTLDVSNNKATISPYDFSYSFFI